MSRRGQRRRRLALAAVITGIALGSADAAAEADVSAAAPRYSAAALYNLANAYAAAGKPGLAVLNYERASLLAPHDPDIAANLQIVRESAHVAEPPARASATGRLAAAATCASPTLVSWLGILGIVLLGAGLLHGRLSQRHRWPRRLAQVIGLGAIAVTAAQAAILWPTAHSAVVVTADAAVLASPVPMGNAEFTLPEAETVRVTARHENFFLIRTRTGRMGWMSRADLVAVDPDR